MNCENKTRLLIFDPDYEIQQLIQEYLVGSGIEVICAAPNDPAHKAIIDNARFDVLVASLPTQTQHFLEMIPAIRQISPNTEIILLSRTADELQWSEALDHGAYDLLSIPPERRDFLRILSEAVRQPALAGTTVAPAA